jgi:glutamine synthetase
VAQGLDWLRAAADAGDVHTVRISFADRLGVWRGKRVPADLFLAGADKPLGFCDGMLVCDVHADLVQETRFSNYQTGYPDFYVHADPSTIRPAGWAPGEAFVFGDLRDEHGHTTEVAPRSVLARVARRAGVSAVGLTVGGRLMHSQQRPAALELGLILGAADRVLDAAATGLERSGITVDVIEVDRDGAFALHLAPLAPTAAGEAGVVVKGALKELARAAGLEAIFMTRPVASAAPSTWGVDVPIAGSVDATVLAGLLADARGLLSPSITALRAGPVAPRVGSAGGAREVTICASSEASPETVVAVALAAVSEASAGTRGGTGGPEPASLVEAAARLEGAAWLADWLGEDLPINSAPLLRAEQAMFEAAVTDWELQRYWKAS